MKLTRAAILVLSLGMIGSMATQAQFNGCGGDQSNGNICYGYNALPNYASEGSADSAFGDYALTSNGVGTYNTALGYGALYSNTTGGSNTASGSYALYKTSGSANTALGYSALYNVTSGANNVGIGINAGNNTTTGETNIAIGYYAGENNAGNANYNIDIGNYGTSTDTGTIRMGSSGNQTSFYAAGIDGVSVSSGVAVYINSSGQLGTVNSSIRFKEDVRDMGDASSAIFRLRPVTFRYKQPYADGSKPIDYGLIAEEVARVYPDLVVKGTDGKIQTLQYQKLVPMMLNELQKQHQLLAQQETEIQQLEKQAEALPALEKRLAALEATQPPSARLEAGLGTK